MVLPQGSGLPSLLQTLSLIADPIAFFDKQSRLYGDPFTTRVLGVNSPPVVFLSSPEAMQAVFTTLANKLELGKVTDVFRPLVGNESLIMQDGSRHQQQRQMLMPALHGEGMYRWGQTICDLTAEAVDRWKAGSVLNIQKEMLNISLEVILRVVFGMKPGSRYWQLQPLLHRLLEDINSPLYSVQFFLPPLQQDLGRWSPWGQFVRIRQQIDDLLYAEIADRQPQGIHDRSDILSALMSATDAEGQPLTDVELRDQLMTLLLLGHETSASGLTWIFYWLQREPQIADRLLKELDALDDQADPMTIANQPYLNAVCKETLRIYPIALISQPRWVKETIDLMGCTYEPGTVLVPSIYLAHRRSDTYPNPDRFEPERFLGKAKSPYEYLPFGGGSRSCIGMALAMYEMKLVLATVLRRVTLVSSSEMLPAVKPTRRGITFVPPKGFRVSVGDRRGAKVLVS
ncbi:cytochrome P450 [Leptolyngbya ohadii]|uniref:cytochrome P450 n=1 Tax=Leptolyngbya ohadii TaxID=1962290 RepID=UPI000B59CD61|nr:cytochrome P450 [Leptolyngbya ohadii]